ncbi:class I SAM-dependent methyltransferase [Haloglycomyces albus]|uniref:class I SAM-dependent methyltransferase n=1 Tax=Haloglycomyces albus TaxID=526067 RepID=UPI00046D06D5|nr:class I SAM-dependent methyltransferase [Haloglycomyces albus]
MDATNFGTAADLYDNVRPTYPREAIDYQLGTDPVTVADIGAGTGKLTRIIVQAGHRVIAVEPDSRMAEQLSGQSSDVPVHVAGAEELPLDDNSVDVVTAGQSFHWFDNDTALREIRRVLNPDGVFAPIWNIRDESVSWVAALSEIIGRSNAEYLASHIADDSDYFEPHFSQRELQVFRHEYPITPQRLSDLVRSRSNYLNGSSEYRADLDTRVADLLNEHPDLRGRDEFVMPYRTYAFRLRA